MSDPETRDRLLARLDEITPRWVEVNERYARASERAEALTLEALRAGVRPKWVKHRPLSPAAVTEIQRRHGIYTRGDKAVPLPEIDAATLEQYIERLDEVTVERREAELDRIRVSEQAERLVVEALKAGVPRKLLLHRPYSGRTVTQIQQRHGLVRRRPRSKYQG